MPIATCPTACSSMNCRCRVRPCTGGTRRFQIFASGAELAWLADSVRQSAAKGLATLLVTAISSTSCRRPARFDPDGAAAKLDRVLADAPFKPAFDRDGPACLATPNRCCRHLGNHDLELGLPGCASGCSVRCAATMPGARPAALVSDGTGVLARVGKAACWSSMATRSTRGTSRPRAPAPHRARPAVRPADRAWAPNAGAQLVIEVMNQVKASYPFVDLLKPRPRRWCRSSRAEPVAAQAHAGPWRDRGAQGHRHGTHARRLPQREGDEERRHGQRRRAADLARPVSGASAQALMDQAEKAFRDGVTPISLVRASQGRAAGPVGGDLGSGARPAAP